MAKNHVEQILKVKSRLRWSSWRSAITQRLSALQVELQKLDTISEELLKYFPMITGTRKEYPFDLIETELCV